MVASLVAASALAAPALVHAAGSSGGAGLGGSSGNDGSRAQPANVTVTASGNGITLSTRASALLRDRLRFTGSAGRSAAGATIEVERRGRETNWQWAPTAHGTAGAHGHFSAIWPTNHIGRFAIRAIIKRSGAGVAAASPSLTVTVFLQSIATWYGSGSWGSHTACGKVLHRSTLGVANRTLPCGTRVALYYNGKTITVPVIDRGPYANHADWDLTEATHRALGTPGIAKIGAVSLRR